MVPAEGGARPFEGGAPPGAGHLLVHGRNRPAVRDRHRSGDDAEELLHREEGLRGSDHLEAAVSKEDTRNNFVNVST